MLNIENDKIIDAAGEAVQLRGVCVGGWMNMESFINGFPGTEMGLRAMLHEVLGPARTEFFFERWLDAILAEEDIAYIASLGANVVRLPLNYRHFESDMQPFHYLESGFARLDQTLSWCIKYGLYAILDLHAVQGWQNPDWHSDNPTQAALFWQQRQFQDRFVGLWEEIARRYADNPTVAGYDLINEPLTNEISNQVYGSFHPDWMRMNAVYRRAVTAIRAIDPDHIIFLEGDGFASKFCGLEAPFADNLAYASHNYNWAGWGPGAYPGEHREGWWDAAMVEKVFNEHEGTQFTRQHKVPLWVGEFGSVFNGRPEERSDRLRGMEDNLAVFDRYGAHWTAWTYKDLGVMGWVCVDVESEFHRLLAPVQAARQTLRTDTWMYWLPSTPADHLTGDLAQCILGASGDLGLDKAAIQGQLAKVSLAGKAGQLLQFQFAQAFKNLSEVETDRVLSSFALKNCQPNSDLVEIVKRHLQPEKVLG
jgi:hypothetical protein